MNKAKIDDNWVNLTVRYKQWQDFLAKGKMKMKKKINKDNKEYYDFDYTRHQYYYSFPQDHILFAHPQRQRDIFSQLLQKNSQDFSQLYLDINKDQSYEQIVNKYMKPLQFHTLLENMKKQFHHKITELRIEKTLKIKEMNGVYGDENIAKKAVVDIIQCELRTYMHKYANIEDIFYQFGPKVSERAKTHQSFLKTRDFDQLRFSNIKKQDIIIYLRLIQNRQSLSLNTKVLKEHLRILILNKKMEGRRKIMNDKGKKIKQKSDALFEWKQQKKNLLMKMMGQKDDHHYFAQENENNIQAFLNTLDYVHSVQKTYSKVSKQYNNLSLNYDEVTYIPIDMDVLKMKLKQKALHYFPQQTYRQQLESASDEQVSYKLNNLINLQLKILWQSYDISNEIKEKNVINLRPLLRKQLSSIFMKNINKLLNIREHTVKIIGYQNCRIQNDHYEYKYVNKTQKESIMEHYVKQSKRYRDPLVVSYMQLLNVTKQPAIREHITKYVERVLSKNANKYKYMGLYHQNMTQDQKIQIINILNYNLSLNNQPQDQQKELYCRILTQQHQPLKKNILYTYYTLIHLKSVQMKYKLLQVINAQNTCILKTKSRLNLLHKYHNIPFNMSKQFIIRFTEADPKQNAFNFSDEGNMGMDNVKNNKDFYKEDGQTDKIYRQNGLVQVKRINPQNALYEGKSILYMHSFEQLQQILNKIQFLCSETVQKRENYLPDFKMTQIVDRLQLIYQMLECEHNVQVQKLNIMQVYTKILMQTVNPQCIVKTANHIFDTKNYNYFIDMTQSHYGESYRNQIKLLNAKYKILQYLYQKQYTSENKYRDGVHDQLKHKNLSNNMPQLSSLYYTEEIAVAQIIQEEEEYVDSDLMSQSSQSANKMNIRASTVSDKSTFLGTQYHLKTSFQEILSRNSAQHMKSQNNKKEEIMNRKKKKILNDTIMGKCVPRFTNNEEKYLYFMDSIYQVMDQVDELIVKYEKQQPLCAYLLQQYHKFLLQYKYEEYRPQLSPQSLILSLNYTHKIINKHIDKNKTNDHYLCLSDQMLQRLIDNDNGQQVQEYRGLYIALNYIQLTQLSYMNTVYNIIQKSQHSMVKRTNQLMNHHSKYKMDNTIASIKFEQLHPKLFKFMEKVRTHGEYYLLAIGNYYLYSKVCYIFQKQYYHMLNAFNTYYSEQVNKYDELMLQLQLMCAYDCWTGMLDNRQNIGNRVFLQKKRESLRSLKSSIIPKEIVECFMIFMNNTLNKVPQFYQSKEPNNYIAKCKQFRTYIISIVMCGFELKIVTDDINKIYHKNNEVLKIQEYMEVLPLIKEKIALVKSTNKIMQSNFDINITLKKNIFEEEDNITQANCFQESTIKPKLFKNNLTQKMQNMLREWIKSILLKRKYDQSNMKQFEVHMNKIKHRHSVPNYQTVRIPQFIRERDDSYIKYTKFRQWLQAQIIIFGCSLAPQECTKLRRIVYNSRQLFDVFWQDSVKHILSTKQLSQINSHPLQALQIIGHYRQNYLNYINLKKSYKYFVQSLTDMDYIFEPQRVILTLYMGNHELFQMQQPKHEYIYNYGWQPQPLQMNEVDRLMNYMKETNPARTHKVNYNYHTLKEYLWKEGPNKHIVNMDYNNRQLAQTINQHISASNKPIKDEIIKIYYKQQRLSQIICKFNIIDYNHEEQLQLYMKSFQNNLYNGSIKETTSQKKIKNITERNFSSRSIILSAKEQIIKQMGRNYFYTSKILSYFFSQSLTLLNRQLQLRDLLSQSYYTNQTGKDQLIFKQTVNKMLAPKIKLNPYLATPLRVQNYFFSGSLKLSYIDQFLNKLRNRAVLIQLAEGGTGYLLKVHELDEGIQALCKSIVGFSEKEFADRFRTYLQIFDDMKQNIKKLQNENNSLRKIVKVVRQRQGRQIKSLLYEKLNDYLMVLIEKDKMYDLSVKMMKNLQSRKNKQLNAKYSERIAKLEQENKQIRNSFNQFIKYLIHIMKSQIQSSRDSLYENFKHKIQTLLKKQDMLEDLGEQLKFSQLETHDSQILLKKLKMQKSFYQIKAANKERVFAQKVKNLQSKLLEQEKLNNLLVFQKQKNTILNEQVKNLQQCSIQVELLKKEMMKKEEEETFQRFRLIKINESLVGKMKRVQQEKQQDSKYWSQKFTQVKKVQAQSKSSFGLQVEELKTKTRRSFKLKTQSSFDSYHHSRDVNIWRQKWQKSESKYQQIVKGIYKVIQNYRFTKNAKLLYDSVKQLATDQIKRQQALKVFPKILK